MRILRNAISIIRIKPTTIIYLGILILLILLLEMYNPLYGFFSNYFNGVNGNYMEKIVYIAQKMLSEPIAMLLFSSVVLGLCIIISITSAVLLPPFLAISNNLILYGRVREGEWQYSIKKNSVKTTIVMFVQSLFIFCYLFSAVYGSYPIMYLSLALREDKIGSAVVLSLWIIFIIIYFSILALFYMYSFSFYPAIINRNTGIINDVRGICNKNFGKKFSIFLIFLILLILINGLILIIKASTMIFVIKLALFIALYIMLLFTAYLLFIYLFYWYYEYINKEK